MSIINITGIAPKAEHTFHPPNAVLWLRGDNATISTWTDLSASQNNAIQNTVANQPTLISSGIGGQQGLRFDGTDDFMNLNSVITLGGTNRPCSVAAVIVNNQTTGTGSIISITGFRLLNIIGGNWAYYAQQSSGSGEVSALSGATSYALIATQVSNTSIPTWTNGTTLTLTTTVFGVTDNPSTVGANSNGTNQFGQVDIYEIIIANLAWTTDQVTTIRNYFTKRYGFSA